MVNTIEWKNNKVIMLDQSRLPIEVVYVECTDYLTVAEGIRKLWIRGAPAIGIAAAMGIALAVQDIRAETFDDFIKKLEPVFSTFIATRPTAVNIQWAVARIRALLKERKDESVDVLKSLVIGESEKILAEDIEVNRAIGRWGEQFIRDGDTILTHCNAGSLATGGYGTATAPMLIAKELGRKFQVIADETRPVLQGARLTSWELMQAGIPVTLIADSAAGALMKKGEIDLAIVGTDRTVLNGDVANKIGTYTVAVLCKEHGIPLYVAAPLSSVDFSITSGDLIPIEERPSEEVTHIFGTCRIAPDGVKVRNPAFDVTPASYVTAIITEQGAFRPGDIKELANHDADLDAIRIRAER